MTKKELYQSKVVSLEEALSKIKSNDGIMLASFLNEPQSLMGSLHTIADRVEGVTCWTINPSKDYKYIVDERMRGRIDIKSTFYGGSVRRAHKQGRASYLPTFLSCTSEEVVKREDCNVLMAAVTPMDEDGFVYLSGCLSELYDCIEAADLMILEVNPNIPVIKGNTAIPVERVDYFVETEIPLFEAPPSTITREERIIGNYIAELIRDGDTIQLGIGGMPDAAGEALMDKKDLGIYTELITSAMGKLMEAGVVTNERKNFHKGKTIGGIVWGDEALYRTLDRNPMVEVYPNTYINDPFNVMKNDNMVSVNSAIEIDVTGQICSESLGPLQYSGTGGSFDFAYGAFRSKGGRGIIAIPSTARGGTVSRIKTILTPGSVVSISRNVADHIVTEYGVARLRDKTVGERVKELIAIAHPDFRADLKKQARELMIW